MVEDGVVRFALALERTTRVKRGTVPAYAYAAAMADLTDEVLMAAGVTYCEIDGWIATSTESRDEEDEAALPGILGLLARRDRWLALPHPGHHLAHASAAFYSSGFDEATALIIDAYGSLVGGGRERETAFRLRMGSAPEVLMRTVRDSERAAGYRRDGHIWVPAELSGVGEIYRVVTLALGFREHGTVYDDAGKTMGLASYGKRFSSDSLFCELAPDGGLRFDRTAESLVDLGFAAREGDELRLIPRPPRSGFDKRHYDLAAQVQAEFEDAVLHLTRHVLALGDSRSLVACGGSFLNSSLNARILREIDINRLFVYPAATDDGNCVGAALYAHHNLMGGSPAQGHALRHVYLGPPRVTGADLPGLASQWGLRAREHDGQGGLAAAAAAAIARGEIVGWFSDRAEFGPRSLGARSILCHPGIKGMKDRLNARVKFRESFRPFAGSVLAEHASKWFEMPASESPFMLLVCPVVESRRDLISEIVHVDGTCRVQTVAEDNPGPFRAVIEAFEAQTGLPLVLNTSFNLRGMPIVERPDEALDCLYGSRLDRLFIGDLEIDAPDLSRLCPERVQTALGRVGLQAPGATGTARQGDPLRARLLGLADGTRPACDLAAELGMSTDDVIDLVLDLRRFGLVRWAGLPQAARPWSPIPQYSPDKFAE
ncbi:MAG TPA: carbamoyltransferase C-terminal domain-containing protein [Streptosporangiaceae bacterium]|nr:carbamoyltransferase C-terminal domain-containing protein [Streptosporangiaceae bacterium]